MPPETANNRDDFTSATKRTIAQRSGFRCAICGCLTEGPGLDPGNAVSIGDAAHITAAAPQGPRYDPNLTSAQRTHADNGLWACKNHHWIIDHDKERYSVEYLVIRKRQAEERARLLQGIEAEQGPNIAAALLAAREASERILTQWREKYRYHHTGIIELDIREARAKKEPGAGWSLSRVTEALAHGCKFLLAGKPGAGKTITLIQIAEQLALNASSPVPLLFSMSAWLGSNRALADHVVTLLTHQGVDAEGAKLLLATGRVVVLLNGWNEAPESEQARASDLLNDFLLNHSVPGMILSTRATRHAPALFGETVLELLPLSAAKRDAAVNAAKLADPTSLLRQIQKNPILAKVTETPLFLGAAIKLARAGRSIPSTRTGLLESFLGDLEETDNHAARLQALPCQDCHYRYQTDIAVEMTQAGLTSLPCDQALAVIGASSRALVAAGIIGQAGAASAIAESLARHHALLYLPDGSPSYGFIHQQFQEWFASQWLLAEARRLAAQPDPAKIYLLQRDYLDKPAWQESAAFVMESLAAESAPEIASAFVRWMMPLDLIRAAELVSLGSADVWDCLRHELGRALRAWHNLGGAHQECALAAMLATGRADFADLIWPHFESDDQALFRICRLHAPFRLAVLGADALDRLPRLPENIEAAFLWEISRGAAGQEIAYAETRAQKGPPSVRVSALKLLAEQGQFARLFTILLGKDFGDWSEGIYTDVLRFVPASLLAPQAHTLVEKFYATDSLELRSGIVECLKRLAHPQWTPLAKEEFTRALRQERAAPPLAPRTWETWRTPALRAVLLHYTPMLWAADREWVANRLLETFGGNLPEPLWEYLDQFPENALVAVAEQVVAMKSVVGRNSAIIGTLLASGYPRVAGVLVDAYLAIKTNGEDTFSLPRPNDLRRQVPSVLNNLVEAVVAKAETVSDFGQLQALVDVLSPVHADDDSLGAQLHPAQRDKLRALVIKTSAAIPSDDVARSYHPTLAVLLGSLGAPEDVTLVAHWVAEEEARWNAYYEQGDEAREGQVQRLVSRCIINYWNWYSGALALFRCSEAEMELLRWLDHPWLLAEGADGLVNLSLLDESLPRIPTRHPSGKRTSLSTRPLDDLGSAARSRADALVRAIERLEALPPEAKFRRFLPQGVAALARLHDPRAVGRLLALDGATNGWTIIRAFGCLQARGLLLPGQRLAPVLEPFIAKNEAFVHGISDQWHAVVDALRLLLFSDSPHLGVERILRLPKARMEAYYARDVVAMLAESPAPEAAALLISYSNSIPLRGGAFSDLIDALAMSPDTRCHMRLIELLHVPEEELPKGNPSDIYRAIYHAAENDTAFRRKLTDAVRQGVVRWRQAPPFGRALGNSDLLEALLAEKDLRPVEQELSQLVSELAETHEPAGGGAYYVFPKDAAETKRRLAQMLLGNDENAHVASRLLASLRLKRLERGQPATEPLHPNVALLAGGDAFWPIPGVLRGSGRTS